MTVIDSFTDNELYRALYTGNPQKSAEISKQGRKKGKTERKDNNSSSKNLEKNILKSHYIFFQYQLIYY